MPPVMTVTLDFRIWINNLAHQGPLVSQSPQPTYSPPQSLPHQLPTPQHPPSVPTPLFPEHINQQCAHQYRDPSPHLAPNNQEPGVSGRGHRHKATGALGGPPCARERTGPGNRLSRRQEALTNVLGTYQQSQDTMGQILNNMQENKRIAEEHHQEIREDLQALNPTMISLAGVLTDMANIMKEWTVQQRAPTTSQSIDQPTISAAASGQEDPPQDPHATSTPPPAEGEHLHCVCCCDLCLEPTMARVTGEMAPAFTSEELERLVDGVLPQYGLLYGPPDQQVSAHQMKALWHAIAKDVRTLGVYGRQSTHCWERWEDLRRWALETAEAQLGMASQ
ncbi:hypothetical protein NDU88_001305 [Pleurodeles waltl]|uniref:Myb/SANT-like DNA-binding domain-containing protein n=1 Tax=Pleurodeles waltl TaxID=8319 RepID=A0AAV7VW12_PLEWA|nr:hypothetical protein NDU88_001305 [Pleurodeles waltl]